MSPVRWLGALAGLFVVAPTSASAQVVATPDGLAGERNRHVMVAPDGVPRSFWLYEPAGLSRDEPVPLVVVLHGAVGDGERIADVTQFDTLAARERFVVAYPDGVGRMWNAGFCCLAPWRADVDDVGFLESLVGFVGAGRRIDPNAVFVAGLSNGAMMAYWFACNSALPAAIVAVAGTSTTDCPSPNVPVSVMHVHGTADESVPFDGGFGATWSTKYFPPVRPMLEGWRQRNRCQAPTVTANGPLTSERSDCESGSAVDLVLISGGGHEWPRSSDSIDATEAAWAFFSGHRRP